MAPSMVNVLPHRPSVYSLSGVLQTGRPNIIAYPGPRLSNIFPAGGQTDSPATRVASYAAGDV